MEKVIHVVGAGLAGVEATHFLAKHGFEVHLHEQRPQRMTPAHHTEWFGELVCSNSLKSNRLDNACGLLKEEMRAMDSLTMRIAQETAVPSGQALSVDRDLFAQRLTEEIRSFPNVIIHHEEIVEIPEGMTILATGPLTSDSLIATLSKITRENNLSFFDASSPILEKESIDFNKAYFKSRYEQDEGSYINCAMNKEEYEKFYHELINAKLVEKHEFDTGYFEGCMPVEVMAKRGVDTLRYGPLKPMGLRRTPEDRPYAVVQLRQDNVAGNLYNIVGFQTNLTYSEQKRVFGLIPGLENATFVRYGLMHKNTYLKAPKVLEPTLSLKKEKRIIIAGQLCGVEGYVESAATGILAGVSAMRLLLQKPDKKLPLNTMLGALVNYITQCVPDNFAPMNANYGILHGANKNNREQMAEQSIEAIRKWWSTIDE